MQKDGKRQECRHCGSTKRGERHDLCRKCCRTPAIRRLYPVAIKERGYDTREGCRVRLPRWYTRAMPGSSEKIAVMMHRLERREQLHHPRDRKMSDPEEILLPFEFAPNGKFTHTAEVLEQIKLALRAQDQEGKKQRTCTANNSERFVRRGRKAYHRLGRIVESPARDHSELS
jgi:hypothetical protein